MISFLHSFILRALFVVFILLSIQPHSYFAALIIHFTIENSSYYNVLKLPKSEHAQAGKHTYSDRETQTPNDRSNTILRLQKQFQQYCMWTNNEVLWTFPFNLMCRNY